MHDPTLMRAFCALNLDLASVRRLHETALALRADARVPEGTRWVPPTRMHVTLKFFGDVDVGLAPPLGDALAPLAETEQVFRVRFGPLAGFPFDDGARVVVLLLDDAGDVHRLAERVEEATNRLGFEREAREFRPHVTLARLNRTVDVRAWLAAASSPAEPATITELVLYRSDFGNAGHEYVALSRFGMGSSRSAR